MANIIEIVTREIVEGKGNIAGIGKELDTVQDKANDVNSGQKNLAATFKGSWTEISSMLNVGAGAIKLVGEAYSEVVGTYIDYADQVRTISQVTGQQAEDVSRLLQVTDDYKIDAEKLTQVMKKMAKEGFAFTTDALADLSDAYLKIQDPVERTNFLFDTFGREGEAFAEVMLQGGAAIRDKSAAISDNLILTEKSLQQAREYEIATDNLNDAVEGLKIQIGQGLVPAVTEYLNLLLDANEYTAAYNRALELGLGVTTDFITGQLKLNGVLITDEQLFLAVAEAETNAATEAYYFAGGATEADIAAVKMATSVADAAGSTGDFEDSLKRANAEFGFIISFSKQYENNVKNIANAEDNLQAAENELFALTQAGWGATSQKVIDAQTKVDGLKGKLGEAQQASLDATNEMIAGFLQAQLAADDSFTEEDILKVLNYRKEVGLLTKEAYDAAVQALAIANNLAGIPPVKDVKINVHTNYTQSGYGGSQGSQIPVATGGGINPGSMLFDGAFADGGGFGGNYLWNESAQSRPEVFVGGGGYVLTKQDAMNALGGGNGGGVNLVLNYSPMVSLADQNEIETKLLPYIRKALRNV